MFGFLSPHALIGLALLAIPVLLHIFKPRRVRQTPFSSLRWLRASQHRISRRIRWHQLLLFALRAAFVTLLVLALAKPILSFDPQGGTADRFVILDTSRSMGYRAEGAPAPLDRGRLVAEQLVSHVITGDRTTVILAGARARALGPLVEDASVYLPGLKSAPVEMGGPGLMDALRLVRPMARRQPRQSGIELLFVTDNRAGSWSQGDIARFMENSNVAVRVNVIDVGPELPENAWVADPKLLGTSADAGRALSVQVGAFGHGTQTRTVRLTGVPGLPDQTRKVQVQAGQVLTVRFELPAEIDIRGRAAEVRIEPPDSLASDDVCWLNLDAAAGTRILVVEPQTTQVEELQPAFHLRMALDALRTASQGAVDVVRRNPAAVSAADIGEADLVLMADVPELTDSCLAALRQRVEGGGGLIVFLGPSVKVDFYNTKMHNPLQRSESLLPLTLKEAVRGRPDEQGLARITQIEAAHPIFSRLLDPIYGDIAKAQFGTYYSMEIRQPEDTRILASISRQAPAVVERPMGAGKVILLNTTANDSWSDLPRRKCFVPLVDRMVDYLTAGVRRGMYTAGDVAEVPLPGAAADAAPSVRTPGGEEFKAALRTLAGRPGIEVEDLDEAGVYRVEYKTSDGRRSLPFVVNPAPDEGLLARADEDMLRSWWKPARFRMTKVNPVSGRIPLAGTRWQLDPLLIVLACLTLLAEMFFVHWLCPKVNPTVTQGSVVARDGFFGGRETTVAPDSAPNLPP